MRHLKIVFGPGLQVVIMLRILLMREAKHTLSRIVAVSVILATMLCGCKTEGLDYEYIEYATLDSKSYAIQDITGGVECVNIPTEHNGYPVTYILEEVFRSYNMKSLSMESIIYIYPKAFWSCAYLESLELGCVEVIGKNAFALCRSLTSVTIPASCRQIEGGAFCGCKKLEVIYFEGTPDKIDPTAFDKGVTIYGQPNSSIEKYAKENGFIFVAWDGVSSRGN